MKIATVILSLFLNLLIVLPARDQEDAREVLKKVSEAYQPLNSYHFERLTVSESRIVGAQVRADTRGEQVVVSAALNTDRTRAEVRSPQFSVVVVGNGKAKWVYVPGLNQYTRQGIENLPQPLRSVAIYGTDLATIYRGLERRVKEARILREETLAVADQTIACTVLEGLYAQSPADLEPPRLTLWVD